MTVPLWGFPWHGLLVSPGYEPKLRIGAVDGPEMPLAEPPFPAQLANSLGNVYQSSMDVHLVRVPGAPEIELTPEQLAEQAALGRHWQNFTLLHAEPENSFTHGLALHGRQIGGWVLSDEEGKRWLIKPVGDPSLLYGTAQIGQPLELAFDVLPFGYIGQTPADPVSVVANLADIEQGGITLTGDPYVRMRPWSIASHGREVVIALFQAKSPLLPTDMPCGWLHLQLAGAGPAFTASLTVMHSRVETIGVATTGDTDGLVLTVIAGAMSYTTEDLGGGVMRITGTAGPGSRPLALADAFRVGTRVRHSTIEGRVLSVVFASDDSQVVTTADLEWERVEIGALSNLVASGTLTTTYLASDSHVELSGNIDLAGDYAVSFTERTTITLRRNGVEVDSAEYVDAHTASGSRSGTVYVVESFPVASPPGYMGQLAYGPNSYPTSHTYTMTVAGGVVATETGAASNGFGLGNPPDWSTGVDMTFYLQGATWDQGGYVVQRHGNQILSARYSLRPPGASPLIFARQHFAFAAQASWVNPSSAATIYSPRASYNPGTQELVFVVDDASFDGAVFIHI